MKSMTAASALLVALLAFAVHRPAPMAAMGRPGLTPVPCPQQEWQVTDPSFEPIGGAKPFFGRYDGGLYRIEIPENWNRELVLFAHGFVANVGPQGAQLRVPLPGIREHLIKSGFAWAASSYRCNGYVPGVGLLDTMALTDLFTKFNDGRAPQRVYLTGVSMGGHVTLLGMHEFPESFAGGFAMCPAGPELFDFFAAVGAAADVVTGVTFTRETLPQDLLKALGMLGKAPEYSEKGRQLASIQIQISGGPRPFAGEGLASRFTQNINPAPLAGVESPSNRAVTNAHIKYGIDRGLGLNADEINARVRRKPADPDVRNPMGPYEELVPFDGKIERPLISIHGTGDLFVPIFLQQSLGRAVNAAGKSSLLTQRIMRVPGHCGFSQPEMIRAFDDLVKWVREGTKPEGDDVFGDLSNAGMKFTDPIRPNDPGTKTVAPLADTPR
jgi:pimeloyl-ACP methyl ester carboxylesterase